LDARAMIFLLERESRHRSADDDDIVGSRAQE
jgi:hypothetical protein